MLTISLAVVVLSSCVGKKKADQNEKTEDTVANVSDREKETMSAIATENNVPYLIATGFEPMWTLNLSIAQNGTYPVTFTTITEEMAGTLRQVEDNAFEGMVKSQAKEILLKVVITNLPCMCEDGETKDPQTVTITYDKNTASGCGRKP